MTSLKTLKESLSKELNEDQIDYGKILALAGDIAKLDDKNVRFSVDASHVYRLGIELVSKQETAVAELIKNAYDADAIKVNLIFKNSDSSGGELTIIDNGEGMSRDRLINGFMRISTQEKVEMPISNLYKRQRAGRKGIGRFAAQRLGTKLLIATQQDSEKFSLQIAIDWDIFSGGKDLNLISNQISLGPKLAQKGTILRIINLRDAWSEAQIQRTFRFVSELLQPFPLAKKNDGMVQADPGFKVEFSRLQSGQINVVASEEQSIFAHALATISAEVNNDGLAILNLLSEKYKIDIQDRKIIFDQRVKAKTGLAIEKYPLLAGIRFKAHYFITDELPPGTRSLARDVLNRQGGIRVYRNGFRVLPYGETFDDWLGLQRSSALRALLPPHHNTNFLGFVEILDVGGVRFEETASREGLIENEAFLQLQDFVYRALMMGVIEIGQAREKKIFAGESRKKNTEKPSPQAKAAELANALRTAAGVAISSTSSSSTKPDSQADNDTPPDTDPPLPFSSGDMNKLADEVEKLGLESQEVLEENGMLRVLASLGLTIGEFTHEVRHAIAALSATATLIRSEVPIKHPLYSSSESMHENIELLRSYVRYFDNAVIQNAHRELSVHEIRDLVNEFSAIVKPTLDRQKINIESKFFGHDLFTRPMHKSEWASIFLNLFTNSMKAIHRAGGKGKILIESGIVDDRLYIQFSDNGDGIPVENRDKIFDAFFTTSTPVNVLSSDSEKLIGTGLGMKIVRDILEGSNGEVELVDAPKGYSTCFRIEVPKAKDEEVGDAKY
ncbi:MULTISPECIES: sensor histidine kinase [unclassified Janthinobacterium]|uniref:sensor histidine kinase n=1 Tax=unclassified Janthinobacterium TaxID=2610881 RepID=UPI0009DB24FF|nr:MULTISPECIES: sensor histidine kinase [unclassified Janthinobacterium]MEC5162751.1 signal transduction histidine kinase [Janthinobacterium sp. CG_S6]